MTHDVIFLSGYICSGKHTFSKQSLPDHTPIVVSDIVKSITGKVTRKELQDTANLDTEIAQRICDIINDNPLKQYVVDGIRQRSIYEYIKVFCKGLDLYTAEIWLNVPIEVCKARFEWTRQGTNKENISFERAFERDKQLGLLDLEQLWKQNHCIIVNNF